MTPLQAYSQWLTGVWIQKHPPPCLNAGQLCGAIYTPELLEGPGGGHDSPEVTFLLSFPLPCSAPLLPSDFF